MTTPADPLVQVEIEARPQGAVARVTIARAEKLNTLTTVLMAEFADKVAALGTHDDLRAVVLTGAGEKAFIGGADIREMAALTREGAKAFITRVHRCCASLRDLPVPVIARINGYALGAGMEVAAACDLRVAAANAKFGMPEVRVGIPSVVEAALLPGLIGWGRTRELLLLGETIGADQARAWGFVERVAEPAALDDAVEAVVAALLTAGPQAVRLQKKLIRQWEDLPLAEAVAAGLDCFPLAYATDEPARMMAAFINRRRARGG